MKKLLSILMSVLALLTISLPAFADAGPPPSDIYYAYVRAEGFDIVDNEKTYHLKPGVRYRILDYSGTYYIVENEEKFEDNSKSLSIYELDTNMLIREDSIVSAENGTKQGEVKKCRVLDSDGLNLRSGPSTSYPAMIVIPTDMIVSYEYVRNNWAYVNYNGLGGWVNIDHLSEINTTTVAVIEETTKDTSITEADTVAEETESATSAEQTSAISPIANTVIICILVGVIIALTAVVILLIVSKKKKESSEK